MYSFMYCFNDVHTWQYGSHKTFATPPSHFCCGKFKSYQVEKLAVASNCIVVNIMIKYHRSCGFGMHFHFQECW